MKRLPVDAPARLPGVIGAARAWPSFRRARRGRDDGDADAAGAPPLDPRLCAPADAEVIETGYDGRERYRLKASVDPPADRVRAHRSRDDLRDEFTRSERAAARCRSATADGREPWQLTSDRGQVPRGCATTSSSAATCGSPAPSAAARRAIADPLDHRAHADQHAHGVHRDRRADVTICAGRASELEARGMRGRFEGSGTLRLESEVHGHFAP